jgi:hypothetical protein
LAPVIGHSASGANGVDGWPTFLLVHSSAKVGDLLKLCSLAAI